MDNAISSTMLCEMGGISDLELPALLENDGNVEKAEACRKQLEDVGKSVQCFLPLSETLSLECKLFYCKRLAVVVLRLTT